MHVPPIAPSPPVPPAPASQQELREFMQVLRRALLMIVHWIEGRYGT